MKKSTMIFTASVASALMIFSGATLANDSRWASGSLWCPGGGDFRVTIVNTEGQEEASFDRIRCKDGTRNDIYFNSSTPTDNVTVRGNETIAYQGSCPADKLVFCKVRAEELSDNLRFILHTFDSNGGNLVGFAEGKVNEL